MLALNGLPRLYHPVFSYRRIHAASDDRFLLVIENSGASFRAEDAETVLKSMGATNRNGSGGGSALALPPARPAPPPIEIFSDMRRQPKYKAQMSGAFFSDARASRSPVPGAVAQGQLKEDEAFATGISGGMYVGKNPWTTARRCCAASSGLTSIARHATTKPDRGTASSPCAAHGSRATCTIRA
jgi:hypothetical protein